MLPHDNYIMHFNKNHDPRNGQFTKGPGGSSSKKYTKSVDHNIKNIIDNSEESKKIYEIINKKPKEAKYLKKKISELQKKYPKNLLKIYINKHDELEVDRQLTTKDSIKLGAKIIGIIAAAIGVKMAIRSL